MGCPYKFKCEQANNASLDDLDCCDHEYELCNIYWGYLKGEQELEHVFEEMGDL